jgi:hypothetical protein
MSRTILRDSRRRCSSTAQRSLSPWGRLLERERPAHRAPRRKWGLRSEAVRWFVRRKSAWHVPNPLHRQSRTAESERQNFRARTSRPDPPPAPPLFGRGPTTYSRSPTAHGAGRRLVHEQSGADGGSDCSGVLAVHALPPSSNKCSEIHYRHTNNRGVILARDAWCAPPQSRRQ